MHLNHKMIVVIEDEPFITKAFDFREYLHFVTEAWEAFRDEYGAYSYSPNGAGLYFNGNSPEGWTKCEGRHGFAKPKRDTEAFETLNALPHIPKAWDVFGESLIYDITYEVDGEKHCVFISDLWDGPIVDWGPEGLYASIPDLNTAVQELKAQFPDAIILGDAENWSLPRGLRKVELPGFINGEEIA